MNLLELLKLEAVMQGLLDEETKIDPAAAFTLVRDMPYLRASSREPETIIREWRGTCSGKHYLLKALFAELGLYSHLIACTVELQLDPDQFSNNLRDILEASNGRFVDVHNYLLLQLAEGEMVVDATWPLLTKALGMIVNETFTLGQDQKIAYAPTQTWIVPEDGDPQAFKDELLQAHFTAEELASRDAFIQTLSQMLWHG
ncbi:MAG: hypothetical protein GY796_29030 [Chloroflexi bacterium]|nr:hypothetical protein [Chloroflexota bacterium]